jgi:dTDP-4-amino-4,6-dideoxygalactose transaminase
MVNPKILSVLAEATVRETMAVIDAGGVGLALLVDAEGKLLRTITDGDLRRFLIGQPSLDAQLGALEMQRPLTMLVGTTRRAALELMRKRAVSAIPLLDDGGRVAEVWRQVDLDAPILLSTPHMGAKEQAFVASAFATNWIAPLGPNVDAFESELAAKVGIAHAAALSSGTAAIHLALVLLGVGQGDTVFCSSLTFSASANPIAYQGAEPVFIDADEATWNMCPLALQRAFDAAKLEGKLPKAVVVVNLYGQSADMDAIIAICDGYDVPVVEDAAESLGATYKGKASGTFGRLGIYSFNGNKIITTSGGGMLVSDDPELIERARFLATQAREPAPWYEHKEIGFNYRMSNILAGIGRGQLSVLADRVGARRYVFERYRDGLADITAINWMPEPEWSHSTRWLSACVLDTGTPGRDKLIGDLAGELIEARPVWKPMHLQPVFRGNKFYMAASTSVSDRLFEGGLCLPSGSNMTDSQIDRIIATVRSSMLA